MKPIGTAFIALCLLGSIAAWHVASAQSKGIINLNNFRIEQVLDVYKVVTKADLVVASNVKQATRTITVQSDKDLTQEETARLLEQALLKQAGVIVTRLEGRRVSVTYNDRLELTGDER